MLYWTKILDAINSQVKKQKKGEDKKRGEEMRRITLENRKESMREDKKEITREEKNVKRKNKKRKNKGGYLFLKIVLVIIVIFE